MTSTRLAEVEPRISTPDRRLRVFVSSTLQEMAEERAAVRRTISGQRLTPVMFELGARPYPPRDLYRAYLAQSDVFVGIYGASYGWVAPGEEVSGLEDEYLLSGDRPKLIYVKTGVEREPRLSELLRRVQRDDRASYKPFSSPAELAELLADDLAVLLTERFAATRPAVAHQLRPGRLPTAPTPMVDRQCEVRNILELLHDPTVRLVSLLGPGGIGKTRVALEAARAFATGQQDAAPTGEGVWFVDLTPVTDPGLVIEVVAAAFGVRSEGGRALIELLVDRLAGHRALLVLDNFEQVLPAAPELARLLQGCPDLSVLVTSRRVLGLRGEYPVTLPPLPAPGRGDDQVLDAVSDFAAVALFVARAQQVRPGFALTDANAPVVAELCRRLDGIPLALELAAAQLRVLTPTALLRRLADRFERSLDLDGDIVDAPTRQRTLRATIEWSHSLLGPAERSLFARLSVFAHTWTMEAAEAVGVRDGDLDVVDTLSSLVAQSLLTIDDSDPEEIRFGMLASVRGYAAERLADSGQQEETRDRLTAYLQRFAAAAGPGLVGPDNRFWAELVDAELEDIRAAMRRAADADDAETVIRIAAPLFTYWWSRGLLATMSELAEQAAALPSAAALPADATAALLWARGMFRISGGRLDEAEPLLSALLERAAEVGDDRLRAFGLAGLALTRMSASPAERIGLLTEAVQTLRRLDDRWGLAFALSVRGQLALAAGDAAAATDTHHEALALAQRINAEHLQAQLLDLLGLDALGLADLVQARAMFSRGATIHRRLADAEGSANCLDGFAAVALGQGRPEVAARLLGAASHARELIGVTVWPALVPRAEALRHAVRQAAGPDGYEQGREWGSSLPILQALGYAVEATEPAPGAEQPG